MHRAVNNYSENFDVIAIKGASNLQIKKQQMKGL